MWQALVAHFPAAAELALPVMLDAAIKGAVILVLTALIVLAMRRASAAARHLVWLLGILGMLILPALSAALPGWHILPNWAVNASTRVLAQPTVVRGASCLVRSATGNRTSPARTAGRRDFSACFYNCAG